MTIVIIKHNNKTYICDGNSNAMDGESYIWLGNDFNKVEKYISNTNTCGTMGGARLKIIKEY